MFHIVRRYLDFFIFLSNIELVFHRIPCIKSFGKYVDRFFHSLTVSKINSTVREQNLL